MTTRLLLQPMLVLSLAAADAVADGLPLIGAPPPPAERRSVGSAYDRAMDWGSPIRYGMDFPRVNEGARGRTNMLIGNAHLSEEPSLVQPRISGPWGWGPSW
jgi:hypothetical protein